MTTTEGKLYFVALNTLERLEIQFVPSEINSVRQGNNTPIEVVGRNNPHHHYVGGKSAIKLQLDFHSIQEDRADVLTKVRWLQALAVRDGDEGVRQKVKLVWGSLYKDEVWIVDSVKTKLSMFNKEKGFLPQQAYVDVVLLRDTENNLNWSDIHR